MRHFAFGVTAAGILAASASSFGQAASPPAQPAAAAPASRPAEAGEGDPDTASGGEGTTMNKTISVFAALGYSYGFATGLGVGARYQWVIVPRGFLHKLRRPMHDEFALEPGFDYFHAGYSASAGAFSYSWDYNEFTPLIGVLWNIWITDKFAVYPKVDIGYRIASWSETVNNGGQGTTTTTAAHADLFPLYFQGAVGVDYRIGMLSLRAEVGWQALRAGVGFSL